LSSSSRSPEFKNGVFGGKKSDAHGKQETVGFLKYDLTLGQAGLNKHPSDYAGYMNKR
jgi:hypothetical protein